jgi:hypothetical protein
MLKNKKWAPPVRTTAALQPSTWRIPLVRFTMRSRRCFWGHLRLDPPPVKDIKFGGPPECPPATVSMASTNHVATAISDARRSAHAVERPAPRRMCTGVWNGSSGGIRKSASSTAAGNVDAAPIEVGPPSRWLRSRSRAPIWSAASRAAVNSAAKLSISELITARAACLTAAFAAISAATAAVCFAVLAADRAAAISRVIWAVNRAESAFAAACRDLERGARFGAVSLRRGERGF